MNIDANITEGDRDQCFADWGVSVVLREVTQTYDPETGAIGEAYLDHEVTAIVGAARTELQQGTAGQHARRELRFLVRADDLPSGVEPRTARVVYQGVEYRIESNSVSATGGVVALNGRRC
jgi:hypothetical protein